MSVKSLDYAPYRKLFGSAVATDPVELFATLDKPSYALLSRDFASHFVALHPDNAIQIKFLQVGLVDVQQIVAHALEFSGVKDEAAAMNVMSHPVTHATIATFALFPEGQIGHLINNPELAGLFYIDSDCEKLVTDLNCLPSSPNDRGCPFAGNNIEDKVDPLFTKFAEWAGKLSVCSYFSSDSKQLSS